MSDDPHPAADAAAAESGVFFSVLIASYNRCELLLRALRSVFGQSDQDYEIIFVDDGSDDGSSEAVAAAVAARNLPARLLKLPENCGIPVARNVCVAAARGRVAAFLDSDDLWHPRYLALLRPVYERRPEPVFAFTDYLSLGPLTCGPVGQLGEMPESFNPILRMVSHPFIHTMSCFSAPLAAIRAVGGFTESLARFSDLDLYVRLLAGARRRKHFVWRERPIVHIPQTAVLKTIHLIDRDRRAYEQEWERGRQQFLDRVFSYPCLSRHQAMRQQCQEALAAGQAEIFSNFSAPENRATMAAS